MSKKRTRLRRVFVNDPSLPLLRGCELVSPPPFKPLSPARQRAADRERAVRQAAGREQAKALKAAHAVRLKRRPHAMQEQYQLPPDLRRFFARCYFEWNGYPVYYRGDPPLPVDAVSELIEAAYKEGCRQGFIEGFVERRIPDLKRSDTGNAAKRKTLVQLSDGSRVTRDERDTRMVAEYESLLALKIKPTPAKDRLADKYGFESWQGVAAAMKSFGKRSGR